MIQWIVRCCHISLGSAKNGKRWYTNSFIHCTSHNGNIIGIDRTESNKKPHRIQAFCFKIRFIVVRVFFSLHSSFRICKKKSTRFFLLFMLWLYSVFVYTTFNFARLKPDSFRCVNDVKARTICIPYITRFFIYRLSCCVCVYSVGIDVFIVLFFLGGFR